jgi:hypothetical protein
MDGRMITHITVADSTYILGSVDFEVMPAPGDDLMYRVRDTVLNLKVKSRVWNVASIQHRSPEVILYVYGGDYEARKYISDVLQA